MGSEWGHLPGAGAYGNTSKLVQNQQEFRQYTQNSPGNSLHTQTHSEFASSPAREHQTRALLSASRSGSEVYTNQTQNPQILPPGVYQEQAFHQKQSLDSYNYEPHAMSHEHRRSSGFSPQGHILEPNVAQNGPAQPQMHENLGQFPQEAFLLDQLGSSYYDTPIGPGNVMETHEFRLDNMDFIASRSLGHESRAYPPLEFPENTPALQAANSRLNTAPKLPNLATVFQSPILPSQNSKLYNQEHLIQKQRQQRSRRLTPMMTQQNPTIPEAHFTPLASPAVTPLELQMNSNTQLFVPAATDFEPLTSPALKAQLHGNTAGPGISGFSASSAFETDRRRPLTAFAGDSYTNGNPAKRRTPHLTPKLAAVSSKVKQLPSLRKVPLLHAPEKHEKLHSTETTPMLPPQGKKAIIESQNTFGFGHTSPAAAFGPGTLMGFTMNRLAELQGDENMDVSEPARDEVINDHNGGANLGHSRKQSLPSSMPTSTAGSAHNNTSSVPSSAQISNHDFSSAPNSAPALSSLSETSPVLDAVGGEHAGSESGKRHRMPGKKTSHKVAEQGRRIRMNQAVHELSRLIPQNFQEGVTVPSKATTIELAAAYIRNLLHEIDTLKKEKG
ncbi:hypothetical protein HF325_002376 [Metschnikowia pulcherrima]|uniref:BHLH domain-containing protein n=1 Tax=Metschnikowia pulcherrima TaxID=27326 RepID=A0A8H7LAS3_9ASCO|nr:hypothetical protein HF325_002376 [Metschnikowia pulcherrima]